MGYEWDAEKDRANRKKHGVGFEQAAQVFEFPVLERPDPRDHGEQRLVAVGHDRNNAFFVVVYTCRGRDRRIISAWKAGRHDRKAYEKRCGEV